MTKKDGLTAVLERHGIKDAHAFLDEKGDNASIKRSRDPDVRMRGSVQLMKNRKITRKDVKDGFSRLKFL